MEQYEKKNCFRILLDFSGNYLIQSYAYNLYKHDTMIVLWVTDS